MRRTCVKMRAYSGGGFQSVTYSLHVISRAPLNEVFETIYRHMHDVLGYEPSDMITPYIVTTEDLPDYILMEDRSVADAR